MARGIRVYVKRQLRLDRLTFPQRKMYELSNVAVSELRRRLASAMNAEDRPAKPLKKPYAIRKSRVGKGNRRNLDFTGKMLENFKTRTVTENNARAGNSTRLDRIKAKANNNREEWIAHSRLSKLPIVVAAERIMGEIKNHLVKQNLLSDRP